MHIITKLRLKKFWAIHPDAENSLRTWYKIVDQAQWQNPADVRQSWKYTDFVQNLTVFDIGGNKYRLIAYIDYESGKVFIRNVLTHEEYDTNKWKQDEWYKR